MAILLLGKISEKSLVLVSSYFVYSSFSHKLVYSHFMVIVEFFLQAVIVCPTGLMDISSFL